MPTKIIEIYPEASVGVEVLPSDREIIVIEAGIIGPKGAPGPTRGVAIFSITDENAPLPEAAVSGDLILDVLAGEIYVVEES